MYIVIHGLEVYMSRSRNGTEEVFQFLKEKRAREVNNMKPEQGFEERKTIHKVLRNKAT